ncbi:MAG: ATP-binding protein, partial [Anaerolineales bacterium]|nr:ATP-binding protein [Anaerolineales bacterium]
MNPEQLLNDLVHLAKTESDLQDICFSLKVDYADIEGSSHKDKARELVLYLNRRGRLLDILKLLLEIQPDLATTYRTSIEENASISTNIMIQLAGVSSFSVLSQSDSPVQAKNPYQVGRMLTNPDNFWGREDERRNICSQLYNRGSSSIVGMRRIGKSSLLYFLSHYEPRIVSLPNLFAYLDLQKTTHHTLSGLLNAAFQQWVAQINPHAQAHHVADMINFTHIIRRLNEKGYHPILCLDEFENLTKRPYTFTDDVFEGWRALANQGQLTFLTASRAPLADIIQQNGLTSSFYNVFY